MIPVEFYTKIWSLTAISSVFTFAITFIPLFDNFNSNITSNIKVIDREFLFYFHTALFILFFQCINGIFFLPNIFHHHTSTIIPFIITLFIGENIICFCCILSFYDIFLYTNISLFLGIVASWLLPISFIFQKMKK